MLIQEKAGIITDVAQIKTKEGKNMIVISHTSGKSNQLNKIFLFEWSDEFNSISIIAQEIIGSKISQKIELKND